MNEKLSRSPTPKHFMTAFFFAAFTIVALLLTHHFQLLQPERESFLTILIGASLSILRLPAYLAHALHHGHKAPDLRDTILKKFSDMLKPDPEETITDSSHTFFQNPGRWIIDILGYAGVFLMVVGFFELTPMLFASNN
jgi:hypothetical protein